MEGILVYVNLIQSIVICWSLGNIAVPPCNGVTFCYINQEHPLCIRTETYLQQYVSWACNVIGQILRCSSTLLPPTAKANQKHWTSLLVPYVKLYSMLNCYTWKLSVLQRTANLRQISNRVDLFKTFVHVFVIVILVGQTEFAHEKLCHFI